MSSQLRGAVLVGFDGSVPSRLASAWGAREAASADRPLWLAHAFRWPLPELRDLPVAQSAVAESRARQAADVQLEAAAERCRTIAPGLEVNTALLDGNPVEAFTKFATVAELLVLGASGQSSVERVLLGSSAAELARRAGCTVLVVRSDPEQQPGAPGGLSAGKNVVIGVDGSPTSASVVEFGFGFASRHNRQLFAVHAWSDLPLEVLTLLADPEPDRQQALLGSEGVLASLLARARERYPSVPVRHVVTVDRPAKMLLELAAEAALLVVGRHGRAHSLEAPLGSVSHAVLHYASCPVAVVGDTSR